MWGTNMMENAVKNDRVVESVNYMLECVPEGLKLAATFYLSEDCSEKVHCDSISDCYLLPAETDTDAAECEKSRDSDLIVIEYTDWDLGSKAMVVIPKKNICRHILYHYDPKSGKKLAHIL